MKTLTLLTAAVLVFAATPTFANTVMPVSGTHDCNKNKSQDSNFQLSFDSNPGDKVIAKKKTQGIKN